MPSNMRPPASRFISVFRHDLCNLCHTLLLLTYVVCLKSIFVVITLRFCTCINCLLERILYDIRVRGGAFDLAVEVTQVYVPSML